MFFAPRAHGARAGWSGWWLMGRAGRVGSWRRPSAWAGSAALRPRGARRAKRKEEGVVRPGPGHQCHRPPGRQLVGGNWVWRPYRASVLYWFQAWPSRASVVIFIQAWPYVCVAIGAPIRGLIVCIGAPVRGLIVCPTVPLWFSAFRNGPTFRPGRER